MASKSRIPEGTKTVDRRAGVVLIFDEVITGFRLAPGGAQEYYGITPDMVTLSKAIAAGAKLAAVAGKESVMDSTAPKEIAISKGIETVTATAGTYVDGTVALAAGIAAMKVYKRMGQNGGYQRLFQLTEKLKAGIETAFKKRGVPLHINILGPSLKLFFANLEPSFEAYGVLDTRALALFFTSLIAEGVLLSSPNLQSTFLSFAHAEEDMQRIIDAVNNSLDKYEFGDVV